MVPEQKFIEKWNDVSFFTHFLQNFWRLLPKVLHSDMIWHSWHNWKNDKLHNTLEDVILCQNTLAHMPPKWTLQEEQVARMDFLFWCTMTTPCTVFLKCYEGANNCEVRWHILTIFFLKVETDLVKVTNLYLSGK